MALVVPNERATVVLDDRREVRGREAAVRDPARELVVPHAVVPAEELPVRLGEVRDLVPARECERAPLGLRRVLACAHRECQHTSPLAISKGLG